MQVKRENAVKNKKSVRPKGMERTLFLLLLCIDAPMSVPPAMRDASPSAQYIGHRNFT